MRSQKLKCWSRSGQGLYNDAFVLNVFANNMAEAAALVSTATGEHFTAGMLSREYERGVMTFSADTYTLGNTGIELPSVYGEHKKAPGKPFLIYRYAAEYYTIDRYQMGALTQFSIPALRYKFGSLPAIKYFIGAVCPDLELHELQDIIYYTHCDRSGEVLMTYPITQLNKIY